MDIAHLKAYSGYFADREKLLQSSSGGGAAALSEAIIREGGAVFGVCYSPGFMSAEFVCAETIPELAKLKGSKYISTQKRILQDGKYLSLWPTVAEKLRSGKQVLFIGLGCDVAALKSCMAAKNIDAQNLFTADLICYGPALPEIHEQYIDSLERRYNSRLKTFTVRHKLKGWTPAYILAEFENGRKFCKPLYDTDYGIAFAKYAREACYNCRFKGAGHQADITLGDFWGMTPDMAGWNPDGVSIFIVKSERGEKLLQKIDAEYFVLTPADVNFALAHNTSYMAMRKKPDDYARFIADLKSVGLHRAVVRMTGRLRYYTRRIRKHIPNRVIRIIRAILH